MKEIDQKFWVTEKSPVGDKVMCNRAIFSLVTVLLLLGIMGVTAYAYFGLSVNSAPTKVEAAHFHTEMIVTLDDQIVASDDAQAHTVVLEAGKKYTVTLKPSGTAQTGFAILKFGDNKTVYHTQQLGVDTKAAANGGKTTQIQFTVASEESVTMEIKNSWGTSSYYGKVDKTAEKYVFDGESLIFGVLPTDEDTDDQTEQNTQQTQPGNENQSADSTVSADPTQPTNPTASDDQTQTEETVASVKQPQAEENDGQ